MFNQYEMTNVEPIRVNVRPIKLAFLIEDNDRNTFEKVVKYNTSMWGGVFNLIIPVKNKSIIDDFFYRALEIYSPDYIISLIELSEDLINKLEQDIFPLKIENWIKDFKGNTRKIVGISIEFQGDPIFSNKKFENINVVSYDKCSKYLELTLKSFFGITSVFTRPQPKKDNFNYKGLNKYFKYFKSINPSFGIRTNLPPLILTRTNINIFMTSIKSNPKKNFFIIIGKEDSLYDMCLFWNIRSIFCDNPVIFLPYKKTIENLNSIVEELYSMTEMGDGSKVMSLIHYYSEIDLLSYTLNIKKIQKIAQKISSHKDFKRPSIGTRNGKKSIEIFSNRNKDDLELILPIYWNISAKKYFKAQIFYNNFGYIEFEAPNYITHSNMGPLFMVDIEFDNFIFPVSKNLSAKLTPWPSRISNGCLSCYINWLPPFRESKEGEIWHNLDIDKFNNIPVIIVNDFQMIKSIFEDKGFNSRNGFELTLSDKGNFTSEVVKYFGGITNFVSLMNSNIFSTIIKSFIYKPDVDARLTKRKVQINNSSFSLDELLKILEKNIPEEKNVITPNNSNLPINQLIDYLIEQKILRRGFKLKCLNCLNTEWYSIEKISNQFECNRCGAKNTYKSEVDWHYKLNEVIFMGLYHNVTLPIFTLNHLLKNCKIFKYVPEIKLIKSKKDWAEVDIACLMDGKMTLGECKTNGEITKGEMNKLLKIVERVKPDKIVFSSFSDKCRNISCDKCSQKNKNYSLNSFSEGSKKRIKDLQRNEVIKNHNIQILTLCKKDLCH